MHGAEKRKHERAKCEIDSSYRSLEPTAPRPVSETVVRDISEGGIRFRATHFIPVTEHKLLFRINIPQKKTIEAIVQPAWIREIPNLSQYDIGAKFLSLSDEDREIIRQFASELTAEQA